MAFSISILAQNNDEKPTGWDFIPSYSDINQIGSEAGGKRDEERDQNRARHLHRLAIAIEHISSSERLWKLKSSWMGYHDYSRYNADQDIHADHQRLSEAWVGYCSNLSCLANNEIILSDLDHKPIEEKFRIQAGRQIWAADQSGLFFTGESPSILTQLNSRIYNSSLLVFNAAGTVLERQHRARRGLQESKRQKSALYLVQSRLIGSDFYIGVQYGFLRAPGRAQIRDTEIPYSLPGSQNNFYSFQNGQSAKNDLDVHYYKLGGFWQPGNLGIIFQLHHNHGRSISVDTDGTRISQSRKNINGGLAWANVFFVAGSQVNGHNCPLVIQISGGCLEPMVQSKKHKFSLHGIYSTRDSDDTDQSLNGFASPRPVPNILGGGASILINGIPGTIENPPLQNRQPASDFSLNQLAPLESLEDYRDNSDPALPQYNNDGIRMGGLQYSFTFSNQYIQQLHTFINYAAYRFAVGYEAILGFTGTFDLYESRPDRNPDAHQLYWQISATGSWYKPIDREEDPWTKISHKAAVRFYSRFQAMVGFYF